MENRAVYLSIKPQYTKLIISGDKNYEFRNYIPKRNIKTLYVYESTPTSSLKYIIELGDIIKYPNKITTVGNGNADYNEGLKNFKYAYKINAVYELEHPIPLLELKEKFNFSPLQRYAYDDKYPELTKHIHVSNKRLVLNSKKEH